MLRRHNYQYNKYLIEKEEHHANKFEHLNEISKFLEYIPYQSWIKLRL